MLYFCAKVHKFFKSLEVMKVKILSILFAHLIVLTSLSISAQITDDFSDGDFTENPAWTGTDTIFIVNASKQLQLNASAGGYASLSIENAMTPCRSETGLKNEDLEWRFWIKEAFAPSSKNFTDVFLCDNYFIRFGEAGNQDVIDLQRVDGTTIVSICRGSDDFIASSFSTFVKVTRSAAGLWQIFIDKNGNDDYSLEAQCVDSTYIPTGDFGFHITFSKSNAQKVYFDDVYIGPKIVDSTPPELDNLIVLNEHQIQLSFNENIDESALQNDNYIVDNQLYSPEKTEFSENHSRIILTFSDIIREDVYYTLTINKIQDLNGNVSEKIQSTFLRHITHENDLVINEIMADPEPSVALPPCEYIEIYNTSEFSVDLKNWFLIIGTSEKELTESVVIQPKEYLIFCKADMVETLSDYGSCYGFSSFGITNAGVKIELRDKDFGMISDVDFNLSWYRDKDKEEGGWSLEQIDPEAPCAGKENWRASTDPRGGSPGETNSVNAANPLIPSIDYIDVISDNCIEIVFNQKMNPESLDDIGNYYITEFDSNPSETATFSEKTNAVQLTFIQNFEIDRVYNILINNILNCSGIPISEDTQYSFGLPDVPKPGDIVINEILFDPIEPAGDYVELFNKTDKIFNLSELKIGLVKSTFPNPPDTTVKQICNENRLFLPSSFVLLTNTTEEIGRQYECETDNFVEMQSFPQYPNSGAAAILLHESKTIDVIGYSEDFHHPLLTETKGVSLERIDESWHSAAAPLYGTPGYTNSSTIENENIDNEIEVIPSVFSPDGDGFDDITGIHYKFNEAGFVINIKIFDSYGRFVKQLVDNSLASSDGHFVWDGVDENENLVQPGIYIIFTEIFDLQGFIKKYKNAVVVAVK